MLDEIYLIFISLSLSYYQTLLKLEDLLLKSLIYHLYVINLKYWRRGQLLLFYLKLLKNHLLLNQMIWIYNLILVLLLQNKRLFLILLLKLIFLIQNLVLDQLVLKKHLLSQYLLCLITLLRHLLLLFNLLVPVLDKVRYCILVTFNFGQLFGSLRLDFFYCLQLVFPNIFISVLEKYLSRQLLLFILFDMDEITKISSLASLWSMVVFARHRFSIVHFNMLIYLMILKILFFLLFVCIKLISLL